MAIKLIAIDIDATLLNSKRELTPGVISAIKAASAAGIKVVLCSGRPITGVTPYLAPLGLADQADQYAVTFGGGLVQTTAGNVLAQTQFQYADYIQVEALARQLNLHFHVENADFLYTANRNISEYSVYESSLVNLNIAYRTPEEMRDIALVKGMFIDKPELLDAAMADMTPFKALSDRLTFVKSSPFFLEVSPKGVSKGAALTKLAAELQLDASEMMAIGDEQNDLSMITLAGTGVAMGNATDQVKAAAQYISADNDHDGVAQAIQECAL